MYTEQTESDIVSADNTNTSQSTEVETLYKKWHKTGFISISYWSKADRIVIEIGSLESSGSLKSATKCFVPAPQFLAYLRSEINDTLDVIYPGFNANGHSFYGGGDTPTGVVARVFKITHWMGKNQAVDTTSRAFKCGHFKGKRTDQGAVTPDYSQVISANSIKMTLADIAEIFEILYKQILVAALVPVIQ
jgi:hypothetical protein